MKSLVFEFENARIRFRAAPEDDVDAEVEEERLVDGEEALELLVVREVGVVHPRVELPRRCCLFC